jgi:hypothetical protein
MHWGSVLRVPLSTPYCAEDLICILLQLLQHLCYFWASFTCFGCAVACLAGSHVQDCCGWPMYVLYASITMFDLNKPLAFLNPSSTHHTLHKRDVTACSIGHGGAKVQWHV